MRTINVAGPDISAAWLAACRAMRGNPPVAYHTIVRIKNPLSEDPAVRAALEQILAKHGLQPVSTVANTIFPAAIAQTSSDHLELSRRYVAMLPTLKRLSPTKNDRGTYFGRLVAFPGAKGRVNQLDTIITRLLSERAKQGASTGPLTAAYEAGFIDPGPESITGQAGSCVTAAAPVRVPGRDNRFPGFPCLSHCSFQLDREGTLHALAHYRSQLMAERAYGNYLGLGQLLGYIAEQAGLRCGELTAAAGYAQLDCRRDVYALIGRIPAATATEGLQRTHAPLRKF
jgi:hypothetical protein